MPGLILGLGDTALYKADKIPYLHGTYIECGGMAGQ